MSWSEILLFMVGAVLAENFVFSRFFGSRSFLDAAEDPKTALRSGAALTLVMTFSGAAAWAVYHLILSPLGLDYYRSFASVLVIALILHLLAFLLRRFLPVLDATIGPYLPPITTNCAVLGAVLLNLESGRGLGASVAYSFAAAIGFALSLLILAGVRARLRFADPPRAFRGAPLMMLAAGLIAMAFSGFFGIRF